MSKCKCQGNVLDLGCSIHEPTYKAFRDSMMRPSLTDQLQQTWKEQMKSTEIYRSVIGEREVQTVFIEPFDYYETAIREPNGHWSIPDHNSALLPIETEAMHYSYVQLAERAQRWDER